MVTLILWQRPVTCWIPCLIWIQRPGRNDRLSNIHLVNEWEHEIEHTPSATQEPDHWSVTSCQAHLLAAMVLVQVSDNMGILLAPPSDICPNSGSAHRLCHVAKQVNAKAIIDRLRRPGEDFCQQITDIMDSQGSPNGCVCGASTNVGSSTFS